MTKTKWLTFFWNFEEARRCKISSTFLVFHFSLSACFLFASFFFTYVINYLFLVIVLIICCPSPTPSLFLHSKGSKYVRYVSFLYSLSFFVHSTLTFSSSFLIPTPINFLTTHHMSFCITSRTKFFQVAAEPTFHKIRGHRTTVS